MNTADIARYALSMTRRRSARAAIRNYWENADEAATFLIAK